MKVFRNYLFEKAAISRYPENEMGSGLMDNSCQTLFQKLFTYFAGEIEPKIYR